VFFGRKMAYQIGVSKSARPCSCAVASADRLGDRFLVKSAIALTWLPAMSGIAVRALCSVDSNGADDRLAAVVHMNMLNPHVLRAAVP
jgi:hypothetical protein